MRIKGDLTMIRTVLVALAAIAATVVATEAAAQAGSPVRRLDAVPEGHWTVVRAGGETVSHCMMGIRSDAANPQPGEPQFMISADDQFAVLRVRAAEWSFAGSRDIAVTLVAADGAERQPAAAVHGKDLIDIAFDAAPERMAELAGSSHLEIRTEGTAVRLPLSGVSAVLPAFRHCLASIGQPAERQIHAAVR
jgi:hypothetical protein